MQNESSVGIGQLARPRELEKLSVMRLTKVVSNDDIKAK